MLLLFDIDGTLLIKAADAHRDALYEALREVHHVEPRPVDTAGRTDGDIARGMLLQAGVDARTIDSRAADVRDATVAAYARLCPGDLSDRVAPGALECLTSLAEGEDTLGLVTGNLEPIARLKLTRAGLGRFFARGAGGFGSDHEDRAALPAVARRRAGRVPREDTVIIGDTPLDIACARADGVRCVAVSTGPFAAAQLRDADVVIDGLSSLPAVLDGWRPG